MSSEDNAMLINFLTQKGRSWEEIEQIISELKELEEMTVRESIFESISTGQFGLDSIVEEAKNAVAA